MATHEAVPSKKHLPFGGARAIRNPVLTEFVKFCMSTGIVEMVDSPYLMNRYYARYMTWLSNSQMNSFAGFNSFPYASYSNGTTEVFDKWYLRHHGKRLRMFRGEYMYHLAVHRNLGLPYAYLEDEPLHPNDHVIISMPFADNGGIHHETHSILDTAAVMGVPVLIDSIYLGLTAGLEFDFSHPAIDTIAVSLSKAFPVAHARIGMRISKVDIDDGIDIYRKTAYENRWGAALGLMLMDNYGIDYNQTCYGHWQKYKCDEMGLTASPTVLFGIGDSKWDEYKRGGLANRLFLGGLYEQQF